MSGPRRKRRPLALPLRLPVHGSRRRNHGSWFSVYPRPGSAHSNTRIDRGVGAADQSHRERSVGFGGVSSFGWSVAGRDDFLPRYFWITRRGRFRLRVNGYQSALSITRTKTDRAAKAMRSMIGKNYKGGARSPPRPGHRTQQIQRLLRRHYLGLRSKGSGSPSRAPASIN